MTSGVLSKHQRGLGDPHGFGIHDFIRRLLFDNAILMYPSLMSKGVGANYSLIRLDGDARYSSDEAACVENLLRDYAGMRAKYILSGFEDHRDFFEGRVSGSLTDSVDSTLHLPGAGLDGSQRICHRQSEIIVTVD